MPIDPTPAPSTSAAPEKRATLVVSESADAIAAVRDAREKYHQPDGYSVVRTPGPKELSLQGEGAGKEVARSLVEAGFLSSEEARRALAATLDDYLPEGAMLHGAALLANAGKCLWFDVETGTFPNRHDCLLLDLAAISEGEFEPEQVSEQAPSPDDDKFPYIVRFLSGGKAYELTARNFGDYYDLESLMAAANRSVSDAGHPRRFYNLDTGDQTAIVVYMEEQAVADAVAARLLPPPVGAASSMEAGKGAEEAVLRRLREQQAPNHFSPNR